MNFFKVLLICFVYVSGLKAQVIFSLQDPVTARSFSTTKYSGMKGSPFIIDEWIKGSVATTKGIYNDLDLKYNVYDNILVFQQDELPYEMVDEVIGFTLKPNPADSSTFMVFKNGISGGDIRPKLFVQVLASGKASLYKLPLKQLVDVNEINAGLVKTFANNKKYYINNNNQMYYVQLKKSDVLQALSDKADLLEAFIRDKKISFKKEADMAEVIKYYNSQ